MLVLFYCKHTVLDCSFRELSTPAMATKNSNLWSPTRTYTETQNGSQSFEKQKTNQKAPRQVNNKLMNVKLKFMCEQYIFYFSWNRLSSYATLHICSIDGIGMCIVLSFF